MAQGGRGRRGEEEEAGRRLLALSLSRGIARTPDASSESDDWQPLPTLEPSTTPSSDMPPASTAASSRRRSAAVSAPPG